MSIFISVGNADRSRCRLPNERHLALIYAGVQVELDRSQCCQPLKL